MESVIKISFIVFILFETVRPDQLVGNNNDMNGAMLLVFLIMISIFLLMEICKVHTTLSIQNSLEAINFKINLLPKKDLRTIVKSS